MSKSTLDRDIELAMEDLLLRIVPGLEKQWQGTTPETIAQIERLAGRPLPSFYRWFLSRMGESMGPLAYPTLDLSAQRVLTCYAESLVEPDSRFLLIGHESNEMMPLHLFYDFDVPTHSDALVTRRDAEGGESYDEFETLCAMLAWGAFFKFKVSNMLQECGGILRCNHPDILAHLDPLMNSLGFSKPIPTGRFCRLYERTDVAMVCSGVPKPDFDDVQAFTLGGSNTGVLRKILGEIATESSLEVKINRWTPPLK